MISRAVAFVVFCSVVATTPSSLAQGRRADYERAAAYDAKTRDLVFRDRIEPRFLGDGARFWYRVRIARDRHEWVSVDPDAGTKSPLFDHARLASALSESLSIAPPLIPESLPLERVEFDATSATVRFRLRTQRFEFDTVTARLTVVEPTPSAIRFIAMPDAPLRSRGGGSEVSISIVNDRTSEVEILWLDFEGGRRSYGKLAPGASLPQRTFARHVFVAVDPSGQDIGALVIGDDAENGDTAHVPTTTPEAIRPASPANPSLRAGTSPDGRFALKNERDSLTLIESESGNEVEFHAGEFGADEFMEPFVWSPDSRRCVIRVRAKGDRRKVTIVESSPRDQVQPKTLVFDYDKPGDSLAAPRIVVLDTTEKSLRRIDPESIDANAWSVDRIRWSPDGSSFFFLFNARGHQTMRVVRVDANSLAARAIVEETSPTFLDYSNKTFLEFQDGDLLWMSERSGWNHLYRIDAVSGVVKCAVTSGEFVVKRVVEIDRTAGHVYLIAVGVNPGEDPYHEHLCRATLDGNEFVRLTEGDGTHSIQFTPDRRYFVDTWSRVDRPPVTELRRVADGSLVLPLETADWSALLGTGWRPAERFVAKGRDGTTDIHGFIVRPDDFDPNRRYPVVEHIYAGPHDQHVPKAFSRLVFEHEIAELGFIVVRVDGMGTNWRSRAFHDVCWRNLKDAGLPDRIEWIRAAAERDPALDLTRVGIFGGSAGGQNALAALLHHGDFYRVAVADCGCHDNRMDKVWWNEAWMGWPIGDWYAENSNVTHAAKLTGKLLLIVGEVDRNVDPASTMQVVDALVRADRDFELLVLPGVGHGAAETPYGRRRRADFLVRHLLDVEPRAE